MSDIGFHREDVEIYLEKRGPQIRIGIGPPPPPPNAVGFEVGMLVRGDLGPAVYLVDFIDNALVLRWVPDPGTYDALFNAGAVTVVYQLALNWAVEHHGGAQIPSGSILARGQGTAAVYFIDGSTARLITTPQVMNEYNFNWNAETIVPVSLIDALHPDPRNNMTYSAARIIWRRGDE